MRIYLNDHDVRRLKSVVKTSEMFFLRIVNGEALIISDDISYFKSLSLRATPGHRLTVNLNNDVFASLTKGGVIEIEHKDTSLQFRYNLSDEDLDAGRFKWVSTVAYSTVEDLLLRDYLRAIRAVDNTHFSMPALDNLKDIISVCTACEVGIQIHKGYIYSSGESLRMFKPIDDEELTMAMDLKSLKELESFGTEGVMHNAGEYFIVNRDGFILGIRKVRTVEIRYPEEFYNDSMATSHNIVKFGEAVELIKTYNTRLNKLKTGKFKLNFGDKIVEVDNGRTVYMIIMLCNTVFGGDKVRSVTVDLEYLKGVYKLLKDTIGVEVFTYPKITRLKFPNGINILLRGELNN